MLYLQVFVQRGSINIAAPWRSCVSLKSVTRVFVKPQKLILGSPSSAESWKVLNRNSHGFKRHSWTWHQNSLRPQIQLRQRPSHRKSFCSLLPRTVLRFCWMLMGLGSWNVCDPPQVWQLLHQNPLTAFFWQVVQEVLELVGPNISMQNPWFFWEDHQQVHQKFKSSLIFILKFHTSQQTSPRNASYNRHCGIAQLPPSTLRPICANLSRHHGPSIAWIQPLPWIYQKGNYKAIHFSLFVVFCLTFTSCLHLL